jgi:uncharacterized protein YlxP (DUF503 family)
MIIGTVTIKLYAPWVHSLKEKRMVVKSITTKVQNKFNVSIAEVAEQDIHQTIVIGTACVAGTVALADSIINKVVDFIESNTEAEIMEIQREIR